MPQAASPATARHNLKRDILEITQEKPNKSKQNSLVLFGFIRPNRGFSMGYTESKQSFSSLRQNPL